MGNYFTDWVDNTDKLDAATLNTKMGGIDTQVKTNTDAIAAINSYPGAGTTLKADVDASDVDADTVDGLHASEIKLEDISIPARHSRWPVTNVWTSTSYGWAKGICIDRLGHIWVGLMDSGNNAYVARFQDHHLSTPTLVNLGLADYKVVDLVATHDSVFALCAYYTTDGWSSSVTAPAQVGKLVKLKIDTAEIDTSWATNGVLTFSSGYTDPWCMVADDTYLWVGLLKSIGEVARVTITSGTLASYPANSDHQYVTTIALAQTGIDAYQIVAGFHTLNASTEGTVGYMTPSGTWTYYKLTSGDDDHQFMDLVNSGGIMIGSVAQRTTGEKVCYWNAGNPDPDADGYITPTYITKLGSYAGTYSSDPKVAVGVDGCVYVASGGGSEHVGKFTSIATGSIGEMVNLSNSTKRASGALHDGRTLWICGTDSSSGAAHVIQLGL